MTKDKVGAFVDRTIGSLCHNAVDLEFIISRLKANAEKYQDILSREDSSQTKKNYLIWYIEFANQRIKDLRNAGRIGSKLNKNRPDQVFKILKFREKLLVIPEEKVVQFD